MTVQQAFENMHQTLLGFFRARLSDDAMAEDLVQEVFLKVIKHLEKDASPKNLEAFVFQSAKNLLVDTYRRRGVRGIQKDIDNMDMEAKLDPQLDADLAARKSMGKCLRGMVETLPEDVREPLLAHAMGDENVKNLALEKGLSESGMKSRLQRGRAALRQTFTRCCQVNFDQRQNAVDFHNPNKGCGDGC